MVEALQGSNSPKKKGILFTGHMSNVIQKGVCDSDSVTAFFDERCTTFFYICALNNKQVQPQFSAPH
jgi:hypothetical protein